MTSVKRGYTDSRHGQLHYRIVQPDAPTGAPPLLCLHQTPSHSGDWLPVLPTLGATRTVVAVDTPGYGMSDPPPAPTTIEEYAAIIADFITELAAQGLVPAGPFDVLGFHTGSLLATQLARSLPDRVRRLVVFGLAAYPADVRAAKLEQLPTLFPPPDATLAHVEKLWAIIGQLSDPRVSAEQRHISMAECLRLGARMTWGYIAVYRYDFLGAMAEVQQPVLIINPEDDLWAVTRDVSHHYPNGRRVDMPGVKHGVLHLEHDRVVAEIEGFLA
ncbi:alpha/beta hydrolase [Nitrospirillum sp. BR 11828]|uniref:alpha/beta fold hydrolase n=1 Tax=Nitrospirillum sp. BR 11828 TaxID=3104325 RepID=UPI002ACAE86C|nr:alpha/beta hydrolase [Nitrospirillum sp. BR 11828]MDZ5649731.1 alpha/beta hydrolase [Nitrospirillum sp. BR 11828]